MGRREWGCAGGLWCEEPTDGDPCAWGANLKFKWGCGNEKWCAYYNDDVTLIVRAIFGLVHKKRWNI